MIGTSVNKEHTKEESRTYLSQFKVSAFLYGGRVRRLFSCVVFFLFKNKLKTDKEIKWAKNQKQKILQTQFVEI